MRYSVVNWYGGHVINDCTLTPAFLRLSGFMTSADEKNGTSRLALFFDNLVFFKASTDPNNFEVLFFKNILLILDKYLLTKVNL